MQNINLNPGGFIGAFLGAAVTGLLVFTSMDTSENSKAFKLPIIGLIGGATLGNVLWTKAFSKPEETPDETPQE